MVGEDKVKDYWKDRVRTQGKGAVGYSGSLEGYEERVKWIKEGLGDMANYRTLDYGCGVGYFSHLFKKDKYLGVDLTAELLTYAPKEYDYKWIDAYLKEQIYDPEMIFTCCVLQHNSDELLKKILEGFALQKPGHLALYECTDKRIVNSHVKPRSFDEYDTLVIETLGLNMVQLRESEHYFKKEKHGLMIWERI